MKKDQLFELIKSLKASDKRNFKLFVSKQKGEKNYLKLFEAIDNQDDYDETLIRKRFAKEKFIRQLPVAKNYLYKLVLKSLEVYHLSSLSILRSHLNQIEILFNLNLFDQCEKLLQKTKELAEKFENNLCMLQVLFWEGELMRIQYYFGKKEIDIKKNHKEKQEILEVYQNSQDHYYILSQLLIKVIRNGIARLPAQVNEYKKMMDHPLLRNESNALSDEARLRFYTSYISYYYAINRSTKAYEYSKKAVALMEKNTHILNEKMQGYIGTLNNMIIFQHNMGMPLEVDKTIKKLKQLRPSTERSSAELFYTVNNVQLGIYCERGEFDKGLKELSEIEVGIQKIDTRHSNKRHLMLLYYNIICTYFGAENYSAAVKYVYKILNNKKFDPSSQIYNVARLLALICHFELKNNELLESVVKSTYRDLLKANKLFNVEKLLLHFIKEKMPRIKTKTDLINSLIEVKNELEEITKDPLEKNAFYSFDLISWIESKIEKRSFESIVRQKAMITFEKVRKQKSDN